MPKLSQSTTTSSTSWSCEVCTLKNPVRRRRCQACESRRPVVVEEQQQQQPDPAPNCINGVGGGGGTEESGSSIASPPSPPGVSASSCAIAAAATSTTAVTESESSDKDPPNTPLVSDWLQRRRRQQRKRTRTSSSLCCSGHNRLLHVTLCVNYGNDAFEALVASIPHSAQPLQSPAEVVLAHESVVVVVAKSITTTSPTHHPHDNDTLSSVPTIDASAVAVAAPVAVTSTATTQTTTSPSSSTTQDHETNILSIAPRMEVVASVAVAKKNVPASTSTPPRLWIAGKSPRDMPPSENPATALGNTEVNLRCDQVSSQSHESGVSIDSCGGAEANNVYHPKPHVTIRSDVRSCTILGCDDKNAVEAPEDRPGPRCDDGAARDMEVESSSQGGSDAAGQVATTTEPGPQSTLPQHISNALMSPLPENETSETDQTQTQRMESASPCRGDIPVPSGTLEFSAPLQDDPGGTPTLLNPHGPVSQTKGTLASEDLFSFAYTQVSSQELESSQENLSQEKNSSRSPNDRTFLPLPSSAKPNSKPPFDLLGDAEQEMACSNNNRNACHTSQIQCCVSGTSPPSTQLNNPAVHSLSHGAEPESSLSVHDPPSITATSSASHPPMFTTAGHRRPICVSESDLNRANHFWDSLESNHHSAGVPPHDQIIRRVGQNRWQRRLGYPVQPSAISAHPRSLGKRSMDVVKSTPTLFRPSSHCKPKDSIPFSGKSNLTATGFQTAGLGETLLVPEGRLHRADALFRDETNIEPPAAKRACLPETYVASGGSNSPPPSPAVASTALGKNDSTVGGCDIDVHPATERAIKPLFVTAGLGRGVDVSADGIARANALWIDQANNDKIEGSRVSFPDQRKMSPTVPTDIRSSVPTNGSSFQGFSTAGKGRTVTITEKSLAQANALLGNALWIDQANNDKIEGLGVSFPNQRNMSSTVPTDERSSVPTIGSSFQGFFTAGKGRTVTVTEETLARASALLGEQYENFETPAPTQCLSRVSESDSKRPGLLPSSDSTYDKKRSGPVTSTGPVAFATAGQRSVLSVTVESMARASALLEARKEEFQTPAPPRHSHLVSLLDASTDLLSVASSERTKTCIPANDGHWLPSPANELNRLPRFTTAGNRRVVTTSAESVARAISLLADDAVDFQTPAPPQRAPRVSFTDAKWPVSVPTTESHRDLSSRRSQTEDSTEVFGVAALAASCRGQFNSGTSNVTLRAKFCSRDPLETFDTPIAPIRATRVSFVDSGKRVPSRTSFESLVGPRDPKTEGSFNDDDLPEIAAPEEKQVHTTSLDGAEHARALRSEFFSANDACEILRENETETTGSRFASSVMPSASGNQGCNEEDATFFTGHSKDSFESVVSRVTSVNAASVRFDVSSKLPCHIVRHNEAFSNVVGALPDYRAALGDLGVDASMIEDKWILNHVRWIVWKLASLERQFRRQEHGSSLTFDAVVKRLKARYNREFLKGERSPLRKVLNRDVSSLTMMILCVARVVLSEQETRDSLAVELTDGWYSVRASTDIPLRDFVSRGTIKVGSKLLVSNSALVGCEDGVDPLDASFDAMNEDSSPTLCISANGSRLAKWDSKLGFVRPSMVLKEAGGLLQIGKISDVLESGGRIPLIELIVLRKYPLLYRGTNRNGSPSRAADSESRYRIYTEQENEERIRCRENKREKFVEGIVDEVEAECMKELDQGAPELWQRFLGHHDPESFLSNIDIRDKVALETWIERRSLLLQGRRQQEIEARLEELEDENDQVTPFIRLLVQSAGGGNTLAPVPAEKKLTEMAMLTLWNPTDEQIEAIREGNILRIKNLGVGNNRYDGLLQLMANGRTSILVSSTATATTRSGVCDVPKLILLSRRDLEMSRPTICSFETDLLGIVLSISKSHEHSCWAVTITDASGLLVRVHILDAKGIATIQRLGISTPDLPKSFSVVLFRQIRVSPFDLQDGCGVADFLGTSSVTVLTDCPRTKALLQWANSDRGFSRIGCLLSRLNARIPGRQSNAIVAFGFIVELCLVSIQQLFVKVDCSGGDIHTWKFPLSLMPKFLSVAEETSDYVVLNSQEEKRLASLMNVGLAFRSRRDLYRFQLQQSAAPLTGDLCSSFEVVDISPTTETDSLTSYFLRDA